MTQSGQGGEQQLPAGRPAHEGVVLPSDGGAPWIPGAPTGGPADQGAGQAAGQAAPAGGQPWGQPWGPQTDAPQQPGGPIPGGPIPGGQAAGAYGYPQQHSQPLPPAQAQDQPYGEGRYQQPPQSYGQGGAGGYPQQQQPPRHSDPYQQHPQQYPSPQQPQPYAQPLPPEAPHGGDADATQYIAPVPAPAQGTDADATQYLPPVPAAGAYGAPPSPPEERQPPSEFDNLFRAQAPADATQQLPPQRYDQPPSPRQGYRSDPQRPQHGYPGGQLPPQGYQSGLQGLRGGDGAAEPLPYDDGGDPPRRRGAHVPLISAVVVGCAVIGLGAGALLSGGGGDDKAKNTTQTVASQSSPAATPTEEAPPPDPAQPQAEALDKLLADSNNSRAAVISAVEKIKSCTDLDQANTDLKGAAQQRRDLVTRLEALTLDELPQHEALNSSLTRAWKASAAADEHYATWARQAKKQKHVCKDGRARSTNETARANRKSGEATKAKQEAAVLWNAIAEKYGLTKHTPVEL